MIEVERKEHRGGKWHWHVRGGLLRGLSRQPLLDACRALKVTGEAPDTVVGLFRPGSAIWDLRTTVGHGAALTVKESGAGGRPRFVRWEDSP